MLIIQMMFVFSGFWPQCTQCECIYLCILKIQFVVFIFIYVYIPKLKMYIRLSDFYFYICMLGK